MADNPWTEGDNPMQDPQKREETDRLWSVLEKTLAQSTIEQRRARRWGIFFKTITFRLHHRVKPVFDRSSQFASGWNAVRVAHCGRSDRWRHRAE